VIFYVSDYTVSRKIHLMFDNNFGKCGPIFKILSPTDSRVPFHQAHLQYVATLLCESQKSKNVTDFDSILTKRLTLDTFMMVFVL